MIGDSEYSIGGVPYGGGVFVFYWPYSGNLVRADADMQYEGTSAEGDLGRSVAAPGDVDGDGRPDLLVGAIEADMGATDGGAAYLLFGRGL